MVERFPARKQEPGFQSLLWNSGKPGAGGFRITGVSSEKCGVGLDDAFSLKQTGQRCVNQGSGGGESLRRDEVGTLGGGGQ